MELKKKKKLTKGLVIIGVVLIAIVGISMALSMQAKKISYKEETAEKRSITTYYNAGGTISAKDIQTVAAETALQIKTVHVKEGDKVKKDAKLFTCTDNQVITSQIEGEVSSLPAKAGSIYTPGTTLASIINYDTLKVDIKVDEYDINNLEVNKEVNVHVNALDKDINGKVQFVSKEAVKEQDVTYFPVTISLDNKEGLRAGLSCEVNTLNKKVEDVVSVSMKSLMFDSKNKAYVNKKDSNGLPEKTYVTTGMNDGNYVEIKEGLSNGDIVLVSSSSNE